MSTVHKLIFCLVGVGAVWLLNIGLDYREKQLEKNLRDRVAMEIRELNKLRSVSFLHTPYNELVEEIKRTSTAYYQNKNTKQYQLATMSPCNPRISSCI